MLKLKGVINMLSYSNIPKLDKYFQAFMLATTTTTPYHEPAPTHPLFTLLISNNSNNNFNISNS